MDLKFEVQGSQAEMQSLDQAHRALSRTSDIINTLTYLQRALLRNEDKNIRDWISYAEHDIKMLRLIIEGNESL